ncbi:MAG: c-type cytochrome [Pseudohongiellaceae bacterium]
MGRILVYCAVLLSMIACSDSQSDIDSATASPVQRFMADSAALARGQAIFEGSCASFCHTMEPVSELDASFLFDCQWNNGSSDQELFDVVTRGVPGTRMVGFGSNFPEGDDDLWKVIAYLRSKQQAC